MKGFAKWLVCGLCLLTLAGCVPGTPAPSAGEAAPATFTAAAPAATDTAAPPVTAEEIAPTATDAPAITPVRVFYAGSLIVPFADMEKAFEAAYPQYDVQSEGHGSIQVIRHVTDIHQQIDVVVTADHALIPMLMYQNQDPDTGKPYSEWYIEFASNKLGLAYTPQSQFADEINAENWYRIIAQPGVRVGIADPRFDASGYRALMVMQLAEAVYGLPTIYEDLIMGRFRTAITVTDEDGRSVVHVPEIVEAKKDSGIIIRGASIALIALMEAGELDYAFEYESVIRQHGFEMLALPDALNLGSQDHAADYDRVMVRMDFQRFAKVKPEFKGELIGYGVTIPTNAPNPAGAEQFVAFLLGEGGRRVMAANYHPMFEQALADHYEKVPEGLKPLCIPMP